MDVFELIRAEGLRRGLSPKTIRTYALCTQKFLRIQRKEPHEITGSDIEKYLLLLQRNGSPGNTLNVYVNALKFFFEEILKRPVTIAIHYSKTPETLPEFLTKEEITRLFEAIFNPKHQLIIKLLYATGMRVSELVSLKVKDFEFSQNYGWVRQGKGRKDRLFVIAQKLKGELLEWIGQHNLGHDSWLFSGWGDNHISPHTIRIIIKRAAKKAKILKNVHPHTLRHSFATHLIQNGYAVTEVQPLLDHSSLNTTMIYLHMASPQLLKVQSPYDALPINPS